MAEKRWWEDHLCQILLTKSAEVMQEAVQMLQEHGCCVQKKLKSEFYYNSTVLPVRYLMYESHYACMYAYISACILSLGQPFGVSCCSQLL